MNEIHTNNYSLPVNRGNNVKEIPQAVRMLEYNKFMKLKDNEAIAVPQNSVLVLNDKYRLDLGSKEILSGLSKLKPGEALVIGRANFNPDDLTISRKQLKLFVYKGCIHVGNMSQYGTLFRVEPKPVKASSMPQYHQVHRQGNPIENYNPQYLSSTYGRQDVDFKAIFESKYNSLRLAKYSNESTFRHYSPDAVQSAINTEPSKGFNLHQNGWVYRYFGNKYRSENSSDRISLNVQADPRLIQELDTLIQTGQYTDSQGTRRTLGENTRNNVIYKVPENVQQWAYRHDPITMYFSGPIHEAFLYAVSDISQKYARQSCNGMPLVGALQGKPWIGTETEPHENDCLSLAQNVEKVNPKLATEIKSYCFRKWNHIDGYYNFRCSAGQFEAVKSTVKEYYAFVNMNRK